MVILEADHPIVVTAEFIVRLPKTAAVFPLKTLRSPSFSRLIYRMIQVSLADNSANHIVVNGEALVVEVTSYLIGTLAISLP
jgi:hypothetical protein